MVDWSRIENFIGYGNKDAPVVFIGVEEGLTDERALVDDLSLRSRFEPIMDLREAHNGLAGVDRLFGDDATTQRTWRPMCHLMLRRSGIQSPTLEQRKAYQGNKLGRKQGESLIAELLPYPSKQQAHDSSTWPYGNLSPYQTYGQYRRDVLPKRKALLRAEISRVPREIVVCYGKSEWPEFEELFAGIDWSDEGGFRVAKWRDSRVALSDHLSGREFNGEEQLQRFADIALSTATG